MRLTHAFELPATLGRVFDIFGRLDLLAPCFPGASVWGRDGEVYHGAVTIKLGPFPLVFEGTARVVRVDLPQRRMMVKANARDRRGAGAGAATVTATFVSAGPDATRVDVLTDLELTGRPSQLGTGTVSSVSDRLADQFVACLSAKLVAGLTAGRPVTRPGEEGAEETGAEPPAGSASVTQLRPGHGYHPPSPAESTPYLQVLPDVVRTWLPLIGATLVGVALAVLVVRRLRGR